MAAGEATQVSPPSLVTDESQLAGAYGAAACGVRTARPVCVSVKWLAMTAASGGVMSADSSPPVFRAVEAAAATR